jgi:hypothetical protein
MLQLLDDYATARVRSSAASAATSRTMRSVPPQSQRSREHIIEEAYPPLRTYVCSYQRPLRNPQGSLVARLTQRCSFLCLDVSKPHRNPEKEICVKDGAIRIRYRRDCVRNGATKTTHRLASAVHLSSAWSLGGLFCVCCLRMRIAADERGGLRDGGLLVVP